MADIWIESDPDHPDIPSEYPTDSCFKKGQADMQKQITSIGGARSVSRGPALYSPDEHTRRRGRGEVLRLVRFSQALTSHSRVIIASLPSISASKPVFQRAYIRRSCLYAPRKTSDSTMPLRGLPPRAAHTLCAMYYGRNTLSAAASTLYTPGWVTVDPGCRREGAYRPPGAHIGTSCTHTCYLSS